MFLFKENDNIVYISLLSTRNYWRKNMAFNPSPTGYYPGIVTLASGASVPTSGVFFPYSGLESYNASTSGDVRQLVYSLIEPVADEYLSLATADKPTQMTVSRTATVPSDNVLRKTYTFTMNLSFSGLSVVPE
jgi:hypothetical protein